MGVVWLWNLRTPETGDMNPAAVDWKESSRRTVDAIIDRMKGSARARIIFKETVCPECSYITRNISFPAQCIYCGGPLGLL